jgi:hypothetical protein
MDPYTRRWVCLGCCEAAWRRSRLLACLLLAPRLLLLLLALLPGVLLQQLLLQRKPCHAHMLLRRFETYLHVMQSTAECDSIKIAKKTHLNTMTYLLVLELLQLLLTALILLQVRQHCCTLSCSIPSVLRCSLKQVMLLLIQCITCFLQLLQ